MRHEKHGRLTSTACGFLRALSIGPCCTGYVQDLQRRQWAQIFAPEMAFELAEKGLVEEVACPSSPRFTLRNRCWKLTEEGRVVANELREIHLSRQIRAIDERDAVTVDDIDRYRASIAGSHP